MRGWQHVFLWAAAFVMMSAVSCKDDTYDNSPNEPLQLSVGNIVVHNGEQTVAIGVTARNGGWTMTGGEPWCTVDPASGETGVTRITVSFEAYTVGEGEPERTATFVFTSGDQRKEIGVTQLSSDNIPLPNQHADYYLNEDIHDELVDWYYNGEARTAHFDANQSYSDFYYNHLSKDLTRNSEFEGKSWAKTYENSFFPQRYIYSYIERNPVGTHLNPGTPLNYGMEFELNEDYGMLAGRILYVEPDSPAARVGLRRGDWFYKVNTTQLGNWDTPVGKFGWHYNRFIDTLVHPIAGISPELGMLTFRTTGTGVLVDQGRKVTLTPDTRRNPPILGKQVFVEEHLPENSGNMINVGYLMYNNFDPAYKDELEATFRQDFHSQDLDHFILDLRYNKSGSVEMAELMGNLLVGDAEGVEGKTFARYEFDSGSPAPEKSKTVRFSSHPDGIGVDTVFVLTSPHTAGAAELLINALRGLEKEEDTKIKLVMIGENTQGLAAGMVKRTVHLGDDEWEYSAWMLAFRCYNAAGDGDYNYGLVPNSKVNEWARGKNMEWSTTWEWKGRLGSTEDPLIRQAVDIIVGRQSMPTGIVSNGPKSNRPGLPREFCFPTNMVMDKIE